MSYRVKYNGKWTAWSASCVEVGDVVMTEHGNYRVAIALKVRPCDLVMGTDCVRSIIHKGGDPRRHPRFVPYVPVPKPIPKFPATGEGLTDAYVWAHSNYARGFEVDLPNDYLSGFCRPSEWSYRSTGYRIRRIGETVDYPLFVEVQNG